MPLPNLIHPINVMISPITPATTVYDVDAREPLRAVARLTSVTIPAQVSWSVRSDMLPQGIAERASGYLTCRQIDLATMGYSPVPGDKIAGLGHSTSLVFVIHVEPLAHYPDQNGSSLVRLYFGDRRPVSGDPLTV